MTLKALAEAVLARNGPRNMGATAGRDDATRTLVDGGGLLREVARAQPVPPALPADLEALIRTVCAAYACTAHEIDEALCYASSSQGPARESFTAMALELEGEG